MRHIFFFSVLGRLCLIVILAVPATLQAAPAAAQKESHYNVAITGADGTALAATVFQPRLAAGRRAPLLVLAHGFGMHRVHDLDHPSQSPYFQGDKPTLVAARHAWHHGYYVITFDARGFGQSGGRVHFMSPLYEGRDLQHILDWAQQHLGSRLTRLHGRPAIGVLGMSYGGEYGLMGAAMDHRVAAVVSGLSWYNLASALAPHGVPKSLWLNVLAVTGEAGSDGRLDPYYMNALGAGERGSIPPQALHRLTRHSLKSFCDAGRPPKAAVLLLQGMNDTLFDLNQAVHSMSCLRSAGDPVHLIAQGEGHLLPLLQTRGARIVYGVRPSVPCGHHVLDTAHVIFEFLNAHLRGGRGPHLPPVCLSLNGHEGLALKAVPHGGTAYAVPATPIDNKPLLGALMHNLDRLSPARINSVLQALPPDTTQQVTNVALGLAPVNDLVDLLPPLLNALPPRMISQLTGVGVFIPVDTVHRRRLLAGIPTADLRLSGGTAENGAPPVLYAGVGVRPRGAGQAHLLDGQVTPLPGLGAHAVDLGGLGAVLSPGDTVGLMVYSFRPQYALRFSPLTAPVQVRGQVSLPILGK